MTDELSRITRLEEQGKHIVEKLQDNENQHADIAKKIDKLTEVHVETRGYISGIKNALYGLMIVIASIVSAVAWLTDKAIEIHTHYSGNR